MRAISFSEYGGPEVLREVDVDSPEPRADQVRVQVRAAGVNTFDCKLRAGAFAGQIRLRLPHVPGAEVAGLLDAVGRDVAGTQVGDPVFGWAKSGGYAERATLSTFADVPAGLSWVDAAALPVAGEAANRALETLGLRAGETLLVHGAAGAVGTIAVQLALRAGATVVGTAGPSNQEDLTALGVTATVYGDGLLDRVRQLAPQGVDAVLDIAGKGALPASIELRGGTDRVVTLADPAASSLGVAFLAGTDSGQTAQLLAMLAGAVRAGQLALPTPRTFGLAPAADAHTLSERGTGRRKIVLDLTP